MMHPAVDSDLQAEWGVGGGGGGGRTVTHLLIYLFYRKRTPSVDLSHITCSLRFKTLLLF